MSDSNEKLIIGDRVKGEALFGDGLQLEGTIIKQDAEISRDAVVIKTDDGEEAVLLEQNAKKILHG